MEFQLQQTTHLVVSIVVVIVLIYVFNCHLGLL